MEDVKVIIVDEEDNINSIPIDDNEYIYSDALDTLLKGKDGINGTNGTNGEDGFSPIATVTRINNKTKITITDKNGTTSAEVNDGETNYNNLTNKPKINNVEIANNVSLDDLNIQQKGNYLTSESDPTVPSYVKGITQNDINSWNNKSNFSGNYNDLSNKPTIPTQTSQLTNNSGFITNSYHDSSKQDNLISGTNIKTINNQSILGEGNITIESGSGGTSDYSELTNKPSINNVSLEGNKTLAELGINNFSGNYNDLSNRPAIPTKTSDLTNDSNFIDNTYHDSTKQDTISDLGTIRSGASLGATSIQEHQSIKTINNQELVGTGNITIETDLSNYVQKTDTATINDAGIVKLAVAYGTNANEHGSLMGRTRTYAQYSSDSESLFISKGTLENVLVGKGIIDSNEVSY